MVFCSVVFLFRFLPVFLLCYYAAPGRMKNVILLAGSLFFYAWGEPRYVLLMLFSIFVDYAHGILIEKYRGTGWERVFLLSSVCINLLLLGVFKYTGLLPLPIGISFYTFQTMSYTIDVYRREVRAQRNLLDFAVFVTMFPQLIAGPIVKYREVEERLRRRTVSVFQVSNGIQRFLVGLAKKVLLANRFGELWEEIAAMQPGTTGALTAWLGILAYAFQIYFDFSGYSDMAIGLGAMLGFDFPENFRYPYISASVTEFWRRWHISLGSWFREYVYIPLGGNRKGLKVQLRNILIVWMLTGVWHGAGWNFLLWGLWFAFWLILEKLFLASWLRRLPRAAGILYSGLVVLLGWVLFAIEEPSQLAVYYKALAGVGGYADRLGFYLLREYGVLFALGAVGSTPLVRILTDRLRASRAGSSLALLRLGEKVIPAALLLLSVAGMIAASYNPFLYFRF